MGTEYRKVIFLDADIMPVANMDYVFRLSDENENNDAAPLLRPNLILATRGEPCNTAMFLVTPNATCYKNLQEAIVRKHRDGRLLPYPHFDRKIGWGWNFLSMNMTWEAINDKGRRWSWHAVHSDQGLMYYYAKFLVQDTSIVIGKKLQNFVPGSDGIPQKVFEGDFETEIRSRNFTAGFPMPKPLAKPTGDWKADDLPYRS